MNTQRGVIYAQRRQVLEGADLSDEIKGWIDDVIERLVALHTESEHVQDWDLESLVQAFNSLTDADFTVEELQEDLAEISREALIDDFREEAHELYGEKEAQWGDEVAREVERYIVLEVVDTRWREHLENMDYLREGVHLRAFAQKDPLVEYRAEGHSMFEELGLLIREEVLMLLFHAQIEPRRPRSSAVTTTWTADGLRVRARVARRRGCDRCGGGRWGSGRRSRGDRPRRRRRGGDPAAGHGRPRQDRPQRPVLVRVRQEVQEVSRRVGGVRPH